MGRQTSPDGRPQIADPRRLFPWAHGLRQAAQAQVGGSGRRSAADIEGSPVIRWICRGSHVCAVTSWHQDHARKAIPAALTDRPRGRPLPPAPWVAHQVYTVRNRWSCCGSAGRCWMGRPANGCARPCPSCWRTCRRTATWPRPTPGPRSTHGRHRLGLDEFHLQLIVIDLAGRQRGNGRIGHGTQLLYSWDLRPGRVAARPGRFCFPPERFCT